MHDAAAEAQSAATGLGKTSLPGLAQIVSPKPDTVKDGV